MTRHAINIAEATGASVAIVLAFTDSAAAAPAKLTLAGIAFWTVYRRRGVRNEAALMFEELNAEQSLEHSMARAHADELADLRARKAFEAADRAIQDSCDGAVPEREFLWGGDQP